jgi:hypothetical protein
MAYARIQNNTVAEILQPVPGFTIDQCFHPSIVAMCEYVVDSVQIGWVRQEDGTFADPAATLPAEVEEPAAETPVETPVETPAEPT